MFENWTLVEDFQREVAIRGQTEAQINALLKTNYDLRARNITLIQVEADNGALMIENEKLLRQNRITLAEISDLKIQNNAVSLNIKALNSTLQNTKLKIIQSEFCGGINHVKPCSQIETLSF